MGFRSSFTTDAYAIDWPEWFKDKYAGSIWFNTNGVGPLCSRVAHKIDGVWATLPDDIQLAIDWQRFTVKHFVIVYLHECGGITRCQIEKDAIKWSEPDSWVQTEHVAHWHCNNCSDV